MYCKNWCGGENPTRGAILEHCFSMLFFDTQISSEIFTDILNEKNY